MAYLLPTRRDSNKRNNPVIIGITTTLNEADGFQRVNVEYINRVAATGAVPILLTPIAGGAEANREHARHVIELVDGLLITGGGDVHPRYYVPDPAKNRDALGLDDLAAMGCGSSSHCRSTGAKVPFCGHYVPVRTFEEAMDGTSAVETVESLDGRDVLSATGRPPIPCLDGLLAVCEDRDGFELELARLAHERQPCPPWAFAANMQVMNVTVGGGLYRDLYSCGVAEAASPEPPCSRGISHKVTIAQRRLAGIGGERIRGFRGELHAPPGRRPCGPRPACRRRSEDRVVEAVEDPAKPFFLGVQWHPEYLDRHHGLFNALAAAAHHRDARSS